MEFLGEMYGQYLDDVRAGKRKQAKREQILSGSVVAPFIEEVR